MPDPILPSPVIEPIKAIANILQAELGLANGQIMIGLENWVIPKNEGMYIALYYGNEEVIANYNGSSLNELSEFVEVQEAVMLHHIMIDVMSFDSSARIGKEKVVWALGSIAAQQAMEVYGMSFATTPSPFSSVPSLEETKWLNRFQSIFAVNALHRNVKPAEYYDTFDPPEVTFDA